MRLTRTLVAAVTACGLLAGVAATTAPASAKGKAKPVVISLGDSFISGEAGRWAGNTEGAPAGVDALGPTAYFDNPGRTAEVIASCHRAAMSLIHFSPDVTPINLACSGALTGTKWADGLFKPGLDFFDDGKGHRGQAALLRDAAAGADVRMLVVSIGGNDLSFEGIVTQCVRNFVLSSYLFPDYCNDDRTVRQHLAPRALAKVRDDIAGGLRNLRTAMREAGHADGSYDVVVLAYPSPLAPGALIRYPEYGYSRLTTGGCAFWNADADWAATTLLPELNRTVRDAVAQSGLARIHLLDNSQAFLGHRLCESTVNQLHDTPLGSWGSAGAIDQLEWVSEIRTVTTTFPPYQLQESIHPNYFGQRALAACLSLAWNRGRVRGGTCTKKAPGMVNGMPVMQLR